jgi:4-hydroxy-tetrahydrodipicolinate reductase
MDEDQIKVAIFGVGTVATSAVALYRQRLWLRIVGGIGSSETRDLGSGRDSPGWNDVTIWTNPEVMLDKAQPDVALIATHSSLAAVTPDIERCVQRGIHVICTSRELAWPDVEQPGEGARLQHLAAEAGVCIVATGINPGFVFDALPLMLAGVSWDIDTSAVERVLDASVFGRRIHRSLGIGYSEDEFHRRVSSRTIRGHIGFEESAHAIADAVGLKLDRFAEHLTPVFTDRTHKLRDYTIEPFQTAAVSQRGSASVGGQEWLRFGLSLHVAPLSVGWVIRDRITVSGQNPIDATITPGADAVLTTAAQLVNATPAALAAPRFLPCSRPTTQRTVASRASAKVKPKNNSGTDSRSRSTASGRPSSNGAPAQVLRLSVCYFCHRIEPLQSQDFMFRIGCGTVSGKVQHA